MPPAHHQNEVRQTVFCGKVGLQRKIAKGQEQFDLTRRKQLFRVNEKGMGANKSKPKPIKKVVRYNPLGPIRDFTFIITVTFIVANNWCLRLLNMDSTKKRYLFLVIHQYEKLIKTQIKYLSQLKQSLLLSKKCNTNESPRMKMANV